MRADETKDDGIDGESSVANATGLQRVSLGKTGVAARRRREQRLIYRGTDTEQLRTRAGFKATASFFWNSRLARRQELRSRPHDDGRDRRATGQVREVTRWRLGPDAIAIDVLRTGRWGAPSTLRTCKDDDSAPDALSALAATPADRRRFARAALGRAKRSRPMTSSASSSYMSRLSGEGPETARARTLKRVYFILRRRARHRTPATPRARDWSTLGGRLGLVGTVGALKGPLHGERAQPRLAT